MSGLGAGSADERTFRPELEGLRAVAVGLVLLFHAGIPGWSGGYVGVDVFFVLSGFLITGLIVRELRRTGGVDLPAFYARRARRLLPAALVALVGAFVLSAVLLPPLRIGEISTDVAAASLYVSNIRFAALATDYLGAIEPPSPVLHYWSLGVEEQFYLFWPALLLAAAVVGRRLVGRARLEIVLGAIIGTAGLASFVASLVLTSVAQPWAFFSLPARAWELAIGGLLALLATRLARLPVAVGGALVTVGVGAIVLAGVALTEATPFPGWAAIVPTLGAALVVAGGEAGAGSAPARLLQLPPVRYVGRISYSLYLWHWPILAIPAAIAPVPLGLGARLGLVAIAVVLAGLSQRFVEEPFRRGRLIGLKVGRSLALAGAAAVIVAAVSMSAAGTILATLPGGPAAATVQDAGGLPGDPLASFLSPAASAGMPSIAPAGSAGRVPSASIGPLSAFVPWSSLGLLPSEADLLARPTLGHEPVPRDLVPALADARAALPEIYADGCHLSQSATQLPECVFGDPASAVTVALIGDSHAAQWFPTLDRLAQVEHWRLIALTKSACSAVDVQSWNATYEREYAECDTFHRLLYERIAQEHPALVVMSSSHGFELVTGGATASIAQRPDLWDAGYRRALAALMPAAGHVVVLADTPNPSVDPPICLSAHLDDSSACATPVDVAVDEAQIRHEADLVTSAGGVFVDPELWVCPTSPCPAVIGNYLVYRDGHHLTAPFATALAQRLLTVIQPLLP